MSSSSCTSDASCSSPPASSSSSPTLSSSGHSSRFWSSTPQLQTQPRHLPQREQHSSHTWDEGEQKYYFCCSHHEIFVSIATVNSIQASVRTPVKLTQFRGRRGLASCLTSSTSLRYQPRLRVSRVWRLSLTKLPSKNSATRANSVLMNPLSRGDKNFTFLRQLLPASQDLLFVVKIVAFYFQNLTRRPTNCLDWWPPACPDLLRSYEDTRSTINPTKDSLNNLFMFILGTDRWGSHGQ